MNVIGSVLCMLCFNALCAYIKLLRGRASTSLISAKVIASQWCAINSVCHVDISCLWQALWLCTGYNSNAPCFLASHTHHNKFTNYKHASENAYQRPPTSDRIRMWMWKRMSPINACYYERAFQINSEAYRLYDDELLAMTIYSQLSLLQSCRNFSNFSGWHRRQHQVRQLVFGQSLLVKRNCMNCAWCGMCASKCLIKLSANYAEMSPSCRGRKTSCCWRPKWLIGRLHNCDVIAARVQIMFISNETESVGEREKEMVYYTCKLV